MKLKLLAILLFISTNQVFASYQCISDTKGNEKTIKVRLYGMMNKKTANETYPLQMSDLGNGIYVNRVKGFIISHDEKGRPYEGRIGYIDSTFDINLAFSDSYSTREMSFETIEDNNKVVSCLMTLGKIEDNHTYFVELELDKEGKQTVLGYKLSSKCPNEL